MRAVAVEFGRDCRVSRDQSASLVRYQLSDKQFTTKGSYPVLVKTSIKPMAAHRTGFIR